MKVFIPKLCFLLNAHTPMTISKGLSNNEITKKGKLSLNVGTYSGGKNKSEKRDFMV